MRNNVIHNNIMMMEPNSYLIMLADHKLYDYRIISVKLLFKVEIMLFLKVLY